MDRRLGAFVAAAGLGMVAGTAGADNPPTGLRVFAALWNPTKIDGESLETLENQPALISDTLNQSWTAFRAAYLQKVPGLLFGSDKLHSLDSKIPSGISLYSRSGAMTKPPELTLASKASLTLSPQGGSGFAVDFHVPASTISLCSTTPSADVAGFNIGVGQYADPCATLSVDLDLTMIVTIGDSPGHMLQVISPRITPSNFEISNGNWTVQVAQVIDSVNSFFGGTDFQQLLSDYVGQSQNLSPLLQGPVDSLNRAISTYEQAALGSINDELAGAGSLSNLIHTALWESRAQGQMLTVLFAPPTSGMTIGSALQNGQLSGMITFDAAAQRLPATCAAYNDSPQFSARAQTGPRVITSISADGRAAYGAAPTQPISIQFAGGAMQGQHCSYTLSHLALGLPNILQLDGDQQRGAGKLVRALDLRPNHWANPVIIGPNGALIAAGTPDNRAGRSNIGTTSKAGTISAQTSNSPLASVVQAAQKSLNLLGSFSAPAGAEFNSANQLPAALNPTKTTALSQPASPAAGQTKSAAAPSWGAAPATFSTPPPMLPNRWKVAPPPPTASSSLKSMQP